MVKGQDRRDEPGDAPAGDTPAMHRLLPILAVLVGCLLAGRATAQTGLAPQAAPALGAPAFDQWRIGVGFGLLVTPDYLGSNDITVRPLASPEIRAPFDAFFLSFRDGLGATVLREGSLLRRPGAAPALRPRPGRQLRFAWHGRHPLLRRRRRLRLLFGWHMARAGEVRYGFGGYTGWSPMRAWTASGACIRR